MPFLIVWISRRSAGRGNRAAEHVGSGKESRASFPKNSLYFGRNFQANLFVIPPRAGVET